MTEPHRETRLIVPAMAGLYDGLSGFAYPFIRFFAGLFLMPHGALKLFGGDFDQTVGFFTSLGLEPAVTLAGVAGSVEFFGGLFIALGFLTRPAAVGAFILLLVAVVKVHIANGFFYFEGGFEYALLWAFLMLAIAVKGGGRLSIDRALGREL